MQISPRLSISYCIRLLQTDCLYNDCETSRLEVTDRNQSSNPLVISRQYYSRSRQRDSYQNIINYTYKECNMYEDSL